MKEDISELLRTTDPVAHEPGLSVTEVQVMRRAIGAAATEMRHAGWAPGRLGLAVALAFTAVLGVFLSIVFTPVTQQESIQPQAIEPRQLQFETPGGTRVVWILNSKFDLPKDRQP